MSLSSVVGITTGYRLDVRVAVGSRMTFLHIVQTCTEVHITSYPMGTEGSFSGVKRQGREADHSPPTSAEVKKTWIYTSTPAHAFIA
jgi:hypothetical protein